MLSHLNKKDGDKLENYICSLRIVGYNSSFYDVGLLNNNGLMHKIYKRDQKPFIIKYRNRYKVIKRNNLYF